MKTHRLNFKPPAARAHWGGQTRPIRERGPAREWSDYRGFAAPSESQHLSLPALGQAARRFMAKAPLDAWPAHGIWNRPQTEEHRQWLTGELKRAREAIEIGKLDAIGKFVLESLNDERIDRPEEVDALDRIAMTETNPKIRAAASRWIGDYLRKSEELRNAVRRIPFTDALFEQTLVDSILNEKPRDVPALISLVETRFPHLLDRFVHHPRAQIRGYFMDQLMAAIDSIKPGCVPDLLLYDDHPVENAAFLNATFQMGVERLKPVVMGGAWEIQRELIDAELGGKPDEADLKGIFEIINYFTERGIDPAKAYIRQLAGHENPQIAEGAFRILANVEESRII